MPSLTQVTPRLPVSDLNRTIAFYCDHFGFAVNVMWPRLCPTFVILRRDGAGLGFFEPPGHQPMVIGYAELYIEVTDSQMLHDSVKTRLPIQAWIVAGLIALCSVTSSLAHVQTSTLAVYASLSRSFF